MEIICLISNLSEVAPSGFIYVTLEMKPEGVLVLANMILATTQKKLNATFTNGPHLRVMFSDLLY